MQVKRSNVWLQAFIGIHEPSGEDTPHPDVVGEGVESLQDGSSGLTKLRLEKAADLIEQEGLQTLADVLRAYLHPSVCLSSLRPRHVASLIRYCRYAEGQEADRLLDAVRR